MNYRICFNVKFISKMKVYPMKQFFSLQFLFVFLCSFGYGEDIFISGTVKDIASGRPMQGVEARLMIKGITDTTDVKGKFKFAWTDPSISVLGRQGNFAFSEPRIAGNAVSFFLGSPEMVKVSTYTLKGRMIHSKSNFYQPGNYRMPLNGNGKGLSIHNVQIGSKSYWFKALAVGTVRTCAARQGLLNDNSGFRNSSLAKTPVYTGKIIDTLQLKAARYYSEKIPVGASVNDTAILLTALAQLKSPLINVPYGDHELQVLDFYKAESKKPTPLLISFHGGGWVNGDKKGAKTKPYLNAGISVASINYRFTWQAQLAGIKPPVKAPMEDAARALQFLRSKAKEWNIDKQRIAATGRSAGGCTSLWLAFHDEMADPGSKDPVARESTRLWTAAVVKAQTSLDPKELKEWTPNSRYGGHAFGFMDPNNLNSRDSQFAEFLKHREELLPWINEYSPYAQVTADDPPVYLLYFYRPGIGKPQQDPTHTSNYGVKLQEKCKKLGVAIELLYPGSPAVKHQSEESYLIESLKAPSAKSLFED
jgi:acetyl esterase/lipase